MATDLSGNVIWYYDSVANNFPGYAQNLEPGGTVMMLGGNVVGVAAGYNTLRQVDLAGDTLRQTNIHAVNAELAAMHQPQILDFDHEAKLLPNGDTVVIASTPKIVNYKGRPTKFNGDMVLVLNQNFQVSWVWNSFHWLNTNRLGTDDRDPTDWLHANSVSWSPEDGDLIVSLRAQDWVIKIDYANGTGNGHIVWKLGAGRQFQGHRQHAPTRGSPTSTTCATSTTTPCWSSMTGTPATRTTRRRIAAGRNGSSTSRT